MHVITFHLFFLYLLAPRTHHREDYLSLYTRTHKRLYICGKIAVPYNAIYASTYAVYRRARQKVNRQYYCFIVYTRCVRYLFTLSCNTTQSQYLSRDYYIFIKLNGENPFFYILLRVRDPFASAEIYVYPRSNNFLLLSRKFMAARLTRKCKTHIYTYIYVQRN